MRFSLFFIFVLLSVVFLSSESEAREEIEENFSITINPGFTEWKETNCRIVNTENGTYEDCDWVTGYSNKIHETNITNPDWVISAPLDSEFTFTLDGTNFSSVATYNFSYKIFTYGGYSGERYDIDYGDYVEHDIEITSSSLIFVGNNSNRFSYNLSGSLSSNLLINETRGQYLGECVRLYAILTLEKNNNSIVEWKKLHTSEYFYPGQAGRGGCSPPTQYANWGGGFVSGEEYLLLFGIILVFGSAILYAQAKLTSWHFTGSYSNKFTQYLALLVIVSLFFVLVFFPPVFCIAIVILFAQIVAYSTTDHYEKLADSEGRDDTKKSMAGIFRALLIVIGLIFVFIGSSTAMFGTLMEASPSFTVSIICFMLFFYLGRKDKSKVDDKPEEPGDSEGDLVDTKKSMAEYFRAFLLLTGIIFIFFGLNVLMTCSLSMPPQCGTLMEASPCFSVSIICFILFFYLGRKEKSKIDNKLEISEEDQPKPK